MRIAALVALIPSSAAAQGAPDAGVDGAAEAQELWTRTAARPAEAVMQAIAGLAAQIGIGPIEPRQ